MFEATLPLGEPNLALPLFGTRDQHLQKVRDTFQVAITHREGALRITGEETAVTQATEALEQLKMLVERKGAVGLDEVDQLLDRIQGKQDAEDLPIDVINVSRSIRPGTPGQATYVKAMRYA